MTPRLLLLLPLVAAGCALGSGDDPSSSSSSSDPKGDQLDDGGAAASLDVWSWNLEHFPHAAGAPERVAAILLERGADIVGLQEVDDTDGLDATLDALPGWGGFPGRPGFATQVAIAYRRDAVRVIDIEDLFVDDSFAFPRSPLAVTFELRERPELGALTVVVVHLKAQVDDESEARRRLAIERLDAWIAGRGGAVLVVGDFNDELGDAPADNVFNAVLGTGDYLPLTADLDAAGAYSYIPFRRLIDHAIANREAADRFPPRSVEVVGLDAEIADYTDDISDHLPVRSSLEL